ncbi:hypothetical protein X975_00058, partial [Stegodyphus mimosarum]
MAPTSLIEEQVAELMKQVNELSLAIKNSREHSYECKHNHSQHNRRCNKSNGRYRQYKEPCKSIFFLPH